MFFFTISSSRCVFSHPPTIPCIQFRPQTSSDAWFKPAEENIYSGVCLRVDQGIFRVFPYENHHLQPFERAVKILNPAAAVKVRNVAVHAVLAHMCVRTSTFRPNLVDVTVTPARKMLNRYTLIKTSRFKLSIR